jgi:hypothetical protein
MPMKIASCRLVFVLCGICSSTLGCLGSQEELAQAAADSEHVAAISQELHGFENYDNPEIGLVTPSSSVNAGAYCTGTAILPNIVITARHCVVGGGGAVGEGGSFFTIAQPFTVTRHVVNQVWRSGDAGTTDPIRDIALLRVAPAVPWTRELGQYADAGSTAFAWGFGGFDCFPNVNAGRKRVGWFTVAGNVTPPMVCPGDSGGPVIRADGRIFGILSHSSGTGPGGIGIFENVGDIWRDVTLAAFLMQAAAP